MFKDCFGQKKKLLESQLAISSHQGFCKGLNHGDTDALTFGKPIKLTVEPKNTSPSLPTLSILSFHTEKEKQETCLAAGFFPKQGPLSLSKGDSTTNFKVDNAALSSTGTYYFAAFSEEIDICKMKNINITKNDGKKSTETVTVQTSTCEPPSSISDSRSGNQTGLNEISGSGDPKGNMMALIVTFLRITFAKAVGVNIMMTVKAFLV